MDHVYSHILVNIEFYRVPRSLLPGGRSSRLRDRQREEREFLVKKAFVEDILSENRNLSVLLQEPGFRLVMWDPDLLPRHSALALAAAGGAAAFAVSSTAVAKNELEEDHSEMQNKEKTTLLEELSLFMEKLNDVYYDDDDGMLNDFQVDSGTLACVACGVLGFPFMSVVQPSEKALKDLSERQGEIGNRPSLFIQAMNCSIYVSLLKPVLSILQMPRKLRLCHQESLIVNGTRPPDI